ncbi:tyrosine-type recombinase/integrase [Olsenella phocaeensis]|uniref:tyrosine-type recombinase/integrase n=1 Tax=Olsenella phocaeensis TaxID=1852385 RepID=UPI000931AA08|nr:site-specific integrase [Olsenella phocaeensis]
MSISKRTLKSGKVVYDVQEYVGFTLDGRRDRKKVTCRTMREAKVEQAKLVALRDARRGRSGRCTFSDYVDRWWWPSTARLAASTRDTYEKELRLRLRPAFGGMDLRDITRPMVQRMVDGCGTRRVAEKALGTLGTILSQAMGDGILTGNVARAAYVLPPAGRRRDNGLVITTYEAMGPLLSALESYVAVDGGFCLLLGSLGLLMGLRPEERYGLDWADVDLAVRSCHVRRAYLAVSRREGGHDLKEPKTANSERVVPIPADMAGILARARTQGGVVRVGPVLLGKSGGRVSPATAKRRWAAFLRWCDERGMDVPHVTIENCRHSYATSYLHAGGRVEDLSRILGHSNIVTTLRRYVRPSTDDLARGVEDVIPPILSSIDPPLAHGTAF